MEGCLTLRPRTTVAQPDMCHGYLHTAVSKKKDRLEMEEEEEEQG